MSNIGVGVVTCGIRKLHPIEGSVIFTDKDRRGAAYGKNELIHKFYEEGKDYIFLFDDDCYPVIEGWQEKVIEWAKKNDVHYLAGLDFKNINIIGHSGDTVKSSSPYIGAYFFLDRECIEKVGYYNSKYIKYGWEDVEYSIRYNRLFKRGYLTPVWINMYLHSMDMFGENPTPNMTQEEKQRYIELNRRYAIEEDTNSQNGINYIEYENRK